MGIKLSWAHCKQLALITGLELASIFSLLTSQLLVFYVTLGYHSLVALVIIYHSIMLYFPRDIDCNVILIYVTSPRDIQL